MVLRLVFLGVLAGCASSLLAPERTRKIDIVRPVEAQKGTIYHKSVKWFDRKLRPLPGDSRTQEPDKGTARIQGAYLCNAIRAPKKRDDHYIAFTLDFAANPGSFSLGFSRLKMEDAQGNLIMDRASQIAAPEDVVRVRPCLDKIADELVKTIRDTAIPAPSPAEF